MSDEVLVRVDGVSKKFCRDLKRSLWYGVQDTVNDLLGRESSQQELRGDEFWAVDGVSFELRRGECLGLLGRNGAGKTTLLKILNGLIKPDRGRVEMRGRIAALIALGAGFNPILTGRENVYVNAAVLGLSRKEIDAKFDEILDFAEIGEFIDAPVQSYSSGMQVRLGFAIATALEPDVLLLDEVLAVGDLAFRIKCQRRIDYIRKRAAVIFVTHDMPHTARICSRTLVLKKGKVVFAGESRRGIEAYQSLNDDQAAANDSFSSHIPPLNSFEIEGLPPEARFGAPLAFDIIVDSQTHIANASLRVTFLNLAGAYAADSVTKNATGIAPGKTRSRIELASVPLRAGRYHLLCSILDAVGEPLAVSYKRHNIMVTGGYPGTVADCQLQVRSWARVDDADNARAANVQR
jgi:lipopolysaccharide transport system ATP-binding protein